MLAQGDHEYYGNTNLEHNEDSGEKDRFRVETGKVSRIGLPGHGSLMVSPGPGLPGSGPGKAEGFLWP